MDNFFTIPTIDISDETFRQTVVDREENVYLGHPTTTLLGDGKTIVTVYPKNHGLGQIVLKKSFDGGLTWCDRMPVPESWSTSLEVPTIHRVFDRSGHERLIMFSGLYPIRMSVSEDNGDTWSELAPIGNFGGIVAMGDVEEVGAGEYIAMFHDDGRFIRSGNSAIQEIWCTGSGKDRRTKVVYKYSSDNGETWSEPEENWVRTYEREGDKWEKIYETRCGDEYDDGHFVLYMTRSSDGGLTWGEPEAICSHKGGAQLCEPCIIRSPDGKKLVVLLRENSRKFNSFMIVSDDNGTSWSEPIELPAALTGDRHTSKYLPDGRLFISFRDMAGETVTKGDWCGWVGTFDDIINLSEGQYRVRIMKNYHNWDCAYPGIELLPDGTIVTTTYGHFTEGEVAYIVSVRFKIKELDEKYE